MPFLADMDAEREALQSTAYPEVQTFCQKHGLMFEVMAHPLLTASASGNEGVPPGQPGGESEGLRDHNASWKWKSSRSSHCGAGGSSVSAAAGMQV